MNTPRRSIAGPALAGVATVVLLLSSGCDLVHTYEYQGTVLYSDGTPAAGVKVFIALRGWDVPPKDTVVAHVAPTNSSGEYKGRFTDGFIYSPFEQAPPDPLDRITVFVNTSGHWEPRVIELEPGRQSRTSHSRRYLDLPPIRLERPAGPGSGRHGVP